MVDIVNIAHIDTIYIFLNPYHAVIFYHSVNHYQITTRLISNGYRSRIKSEFRKPAILFLLCERNFV
ncbi:hypothetical protein TDB9533_02034 [Thalassocella blandensis]|nr:hypothetical protein TDB9533_02034 [Thalassocella blandensis]